jgi:ABC-2 type transport system ATP-binding protein
VTVEEVERLKARAVRRLQIVFSNPVPAAEFADLAGVQRVTGTHDGRGIDVSVKGSVDAVLKQASRHRMENVITHEGDLEEAFLAYYRDDADDAA